MGLIEEIIANAQANKQRIVLPEGDEPRTLKAADRIVADHQSADRQKSLYQVVIHCKSKIQNIQEITKNPSRCIINLLGFLFSQDSS